MNLDISEYHPLDHSLFACRGYPGGRRRHLSYLWEFQSRVWLRAHTTCALGFHSPGQFWSPDAIWEGCQWCLRPLSARQPH